MAEIGGRGVVERIRECWTPFAAAVDGLDEAELVRPLGHGWTAKEMLAHVAFWDEAVAGAVTAMFRGQPLPEGWGFGSGYVPDRGEWPSATVHNAREAAWARGQALEAVLARLRTAHAGLLEFTATVTDEEVAAHAEYFAHLGDHYGEHLKDLEGVGQAKN